MNTFNDGGELAFQKYFDADNMTNLQGALIALMTTKYREEIINNFYQNWKDDKLVIDKWFAIQAIHTGPETALTIDQTADNDGIRLYGYDDVSSYYGELFIDSSGYTNLDAGTNRGVVIKGHAIDFYINSGGTHFARMTWDGNFGIGDTTPSYKLDVAGTGRFTGNLRTDGEFTVGGNSVAKMNGSVVEIGNPDGNSVSTKIHGFDSSGYLLVGENLITADDASILGISGTANAPAFQLGSANDGFFHSGGISVQVNNVTEFLLADGGIFHADGDIIAYSTSTASDIRLKTNIQPISGSLNKLEQLRPVEFDWLVDRDRHEYGLIAQEVEKVLPEIVVENKAIGDTKKFLNDLDGTEDFKTVDYSKLNVLLIDAIKEQQKQIEELKKEIKEIKNGST